jgi:hypothetical protein
MQDMNEWSKKVLRFQSYCCDDDDNDKDDDDEATKKTAKWIQKWKIFATKQAKTKFKFSRQKEKANNR